jgi:hypothetical protein
LRFEGNTGRSVSATTWLRDNFMRAAAARAGRSRAWHFGNELLPHLES